MTPREQLRKMTALGEQGPLDEKHWYRLVNGMSAGELRQRQEMIMRNQMAMAPQILSQGQQRLQGVPSQFEPRFMERELGPPTEMVSSEARQMHLGTHLGPPLMQHANILPGRTFSGAGYGFLPSEPMETVARRQELIHKQNIARMEMNAILHQKELENAHQKGLMGMENPMMYQANAMAFRGQRQRMSDGHDVFVDRPTLEDLHSNSMVMSASPYPPIGALHRERGRRMDPELTAGAVRKNYKEAEQSLRKACGNGQDGCPDTASGAGGEKDMAGQCSAFQDKFMFPAAAGNLTGVPHMFPGPGLIPPGQPSVYLNGEEASENMRKWTVDDVYHFISSIPTCSEYAQMFKEHMIDGETLPLLSEEHLLDTLGLKLGPALKVRSQVLRRLGSMFYMMNLPLPAAAAAAAAAQATAAQAASDKPGDRSSEVGSPVVCHSEEILGSPREDVLKMEHLNEPENHSPPSACSETA
ncbi:hypothetical protein NHX12_005016 [Muraenolepis orangiensis]|uniref:SAM domain-containing protein n=1 Tax=Muraenolepis orangiensis TaxID=630683 RepID=A0A9Q0DY89_9TELE|nr:hypothetical protein NHX12_005016 [Muraenolepis orangiensis]